MISARIAGLKVQGIRRFQESKSFEFSGPDGHPPGTLVLAGPNGSGKTSFFESILYALGQEQLIHRQLNTGHRQNWLDMALTPDVRVELSLDVESAVGTVLGTRTPCRIDVSRSHSGWSISIQGEATPLSDDAGVIQSLLAEVPILWFSSWRQSYLPGAVRPLADIPAGVPKEASRLWEVKQRVVNERLRSAFRGRTGRDADWLANINKAWTLLRGNDGTYIVVLEDKPDDDESLFDLFVQRATDGMLDDVKKCPIDLLSSGELEWLALSGTLVTTDFKGVVLIDEPELHLHPEWQARLLPALRAAAPDCQLVLASHADSPWDQVFSFERVLLVPSRDPRTGDSL